MSDKAVFTQISEWFQEKANSTALKWPLIRVLISLLISSLGGAAFLGFLNRYALYNYTVGYGARLPVEGVSFLDIAVSILFFCMSTITLTGLFILRWCLEITRNRVSSIIKNKKPSNKTIIAIYCTAIILGICLLLSISIYFEFKSELLIIFTLTFVATCSALFLITRGKSWHISISFTLVLICLVLLNLFSLDNYAGFLRTIGYGGGIPIALINDEHETDESSRDIGYLFLQTNDHYVLWYSQAVSGRAKPVYRFREVPKTNVTVVEFLQSADARLPNKLGSILDLLRHLWQRNVSTKSEMSGAPSLSNLRDKKSE